MNAQRLVIWFAAAAVAASAVAIEPPPEPAPQAEAEPAEPAVPDAGTDADGPAADATGPARAADAKDDETLPPLPPEAAPAGPPPQRFNPTEKVRADFPVSFPIDI